MKDIKTYIKARAKLIPFEILFLVLGAGILTGDIYKWIDWLMDTFGAVPVIIVGIALNVVLWGNLIRQERKDK